MKINLFMRKKWILTMLIVSLLVASVSGCGSKKQSVEKEPAVGEKAEKMEIQIVSDRGIEINHDAEVVKQLEERYNVTFVGVDLGAAYMDTYQTMIASGDIPDIFQWIPRSNFDQFQQRGVFAEIPEDMIKEYAPDLYAWYQKYIDEDDLFKYTSVDGKIYGLPVLWTIGSTVATSAIREDWLSNVGITKVPEALDELHEALYAFRYDDPDGNGEKDTYGMTAALGGSTTPNMFTSIFGAFGVYPGMFSEEEGVIVRGEVEPAAKEALEVLHQWYEEELIDPEFVVNQTATVQEKWIAEKYGYVEGNWYQFIPAVAFNDGYYYDSLLEKNGTTELAIMAGPKGPDGEYGMNQTNPMRGDMVNFGAHMEDEPELMAKYLEIMNDAMNEEILELMWEGVEGVTFERTDDGGYEFIGEYTDAEKRNEYGIGFQALASNFPDYDLLAPFMTEPQYMELRTETASIGTGKIDPLAAVQMESWTELSDKLNQYATKSLIEFITGERSLDEFDAYVQEWMDMGGSRVLQEAQEVYDNLN